MIDTPFSLQSRIVASDGYISTEMEGEMVLRSITTGRYLGLNRVAARVWELVEDARTIESIRDQLIRDFPDVDETTCTRELLSLLASFHSLGLIETA
jgi:hypothetical protein